MSADEERDQTVTAVAPSPDHRDAILARALVVVDGPDRQKRFPIDAEHPGRILIGTSPACEIRLSDRTISRRHAALEVDDGALRLVDLGSTNGTFVNAVRVHDAELEAGQLVRAGATTLRVEAEATPSREARPSATHFGRVAGASAAMRRIYPLCARLAASSVPVVVEGETGTGKEVLAEALHEASPRAAGAFVVFDCTAVAPNLVEAELFGHEKGAFTGATGARRGVFEQAHGGTLLIDEIGDLELSLQPKLLRALERSSVRRIGGSQPLHVDVRVIAATRRDLDREVQAGRFRDDLFHRIAVTRIELPPLRARHGDVALLARRFWSDLGGERGGPPDHVLVRWADLPWPGNVRELRNAVARMVALGDDAPDSAAPTASLTASANDFLDGLVARGLPLPLGRRRAVEEFERRYVERVLAQHGGNVGKAAAASGIARRYFQTIRNRSGG